MFTHENEVKFVEAVSRLCMHVARMATAFESIAKEKKRENDICEQGLTQNAELVELVGKGFSKLDDRLTKNEQRLNNMFQYLVEMENRRISKNETEGEEKTNDAHAEN